MWVCFLGMNSAFGHAGPSSLIAILYIYIQHMHTSARCQAWHWYLLSRLCIEEWGGFPVTWGRTSPSCLADGGNAWRFTRSSAHAFLRKRRLCYLAPRLKFESALWMPKALFQRVTSGGSNRSWQKHTHTHIHTHGVGVLAWLWRGWSLQLKRRRTNYLQSGLRQKDDRGGKRLSRSSWAWSRSGLLIVTSSIFFFLMVNLHSRVEQ